MLTTVEYFMLHSYLCFDQLLTQTMLGYKNSQTSLSFESSRFSVLFKNLLFTAAQIRHQKLGNIRRNIISSTDKQDALANNTVILVLRSRSVNLLRNRRDRQVIPQHRVSLDLAFFFDSLKSLNSRPTHGNGVLG